MTQSMVDTCAAHRTTCHFSGRVQGVGFRYTTTNIAMRHNVTGYVKNLPDGRVELVMEGPDQEIECVVGALKQKMGPFIHHTDVSQYPATGEFPRFYIRH